MRRHVRNVYDSVKDTDPSEPLNNMTNMTFRNPFSMMVTGPSQSGKNGMDQKTVTLAINTTASQTYPMVFWTMATFVR